MGTQDFYMLRKEPGILKQTKGTVNFYPGVYENISGSLTEKSTYWWFPRSKNLDRTSTSIHWQNAQVIFGHISFIISLRV